MAVSLGVVIGLVSDTHGLVRPEIFGALDGAELILHAGDVGGPGVLEALRAIAPVQAVYGNVDPPGDPSLSPSIEWIADGVGIHVSHGHELGSPSVESLLARYDADVIVYGHTHKALVHRAGTRLVVNPGAAGPKRFNLRPSVAVLTVANGRPDVDIIWL